MIEWRRGLLWPFAEGTRLPWNVSLAARGGVADRGLPAGFAQGFYK